MFGGVEYKLIPAIRAGIHDHNLPGRDQSGAILPKKISGKVIYKADNTGLTQFPIEILCNLRLREVGLCKNKLTSLPSDITCLTSLAVLKLEDNHLQEVPTFVTELRKLKILCLARNKLEAVPVQLAKLVKLQVLTLDGNPLSARAPGASSDTTWQQLWSSCETAETLPHLLISQPHKPSTDGAKDVEGRDCSDKSAESPLKHAPLSSHHDGAAGHHPLSRTGSKTLTAVSSQFSTRQLQQTSQFLAALKDLLSPPDLAELQSLLQQKLQQETKADFAWQAKVADFEGLQQLLQRVREAQLEAEERVVKQRLELVRKMRQAKEQQDLATLNDVMTAWKDLSKPGMPVGPDFDSALQVMSKLKEKFMMQAWRLAPPDTVSVTSRDSGGSETPKSFRDLQRERMMTQGIMTYKQWVKCKKQQEEEEEARLRKAMANTKKTQVKKSKMVADATLKELEMERAWPSRVEPDSFPRGTFSLPYDKVKEVKKTYTRVRSKSPGPRDSISEWGDRPRATSDFETFEEDDQYHGQQGGGSKAASVGAGGDE